MMDDTARLQGRCQCGAVTLSASAGLFGPVTGKRIVRHLWEGSRADWYGI